MNSISERIMGIDMKLETGISMFQVYVPQQGELLQKKRNFTYCYKRLWTMPNIRVTSHCVEIGMVISGFEHNMGTFGIGKKI